MEDIYYYNALRSVWSAPLQFGERVIFCDKYGRKHTASIDHYFINSYVVTECFGKKKMTINEACIERR